MNSLIADVLPAGCVLAVCEPSVAGLVSELPPEEKSYIAGAALKRQREFAAGRFAARRCLVQLGLPPVSLPVGKGREPCWPPHVTGSIFHTTGYCVAVAARLSSIASIGVDAEAEVHLETALWDLVLTERERAWVESLSPEIRGVGAKVVFSAKESVYKCQYPITRTFLEFREVEVECEPTAARLVSGRFVAHLPIVPCPPLRGFWRSSEQRVDTVTWLPLA